MAETCIVCLGDLHHHDAGASASDHAPSVTSKSPLRVPEADATILSTTQPRYSDGDRELVAHLLPCGHHLHDDCLKPWVERANSCPMCRAPFNMVELSASLGGPVLSSYAVQDKQQVAEIDPTMIVEEGIIGYDDPCMVCDSYGDESELLLCDGCSNTCHVVCAGLDGIPAGAWFCYTCQEDPQILASNFRTDAQVRRNRRRSRPLAWERVWRSVFDRLNFDLEFPFSEDEDVPNQERAEAERREFREWRRRFEVAARQGAATRFRNTATILHERERNRPAPESQEEIRAWNAFEKARVIEEGGDEPARNRRKRKSPTASPREQPTEPERKFKRPRTRRPQTVAESSESPGPSSRARPPRPHIAAPSASRPRPVPSEANGGPTFLQSLLTEVESHPARSGPEVEQYPDFYSDAGSGNERSPSPHNSSRDASPAASNHPSPRSVTPPPHSPIARPASPLASTITPVFPPAPEFSPFSPVEDSVERARSRQRRNPDSSPSHSPSHSPTRAPMSYEMKSEIQKMVKTALKPHYNKKSVDSDAYTSINRDVSRMLYDKVWDAGGLVDQAARERWQKVAAEEVAVAVKGKGLKKTETMDEVSNGTTNEIPVRTVATPT